MSSSTLFIVIASLLVVMATILFFYLIKYRTKNRKILTIQTVALFSVFLSLSIILSFISFPGPGIIPGVSLGFDEVPIMVMGFLLGPLEGFVFGVIVDLITTLTSGYGWLFVYALVKPTTGLIAGIIGNQKENFQQKKGIMISTILTQIFIVSLFIVSMVLLNVLSISGANYDGWGTSPDYFTSSEIETLNISISVIFSVTMIVYWIVWFKIDKENLAYLNMSVSIVVVQCIFTSFIFNSAAADLYYGVPYYLSVVARCYTNPMLIPLEAGLLYGILKGTKYAFSRMSKPEDRWI